MSDQAGDWLGLAAAIVAASSALTGLVFVSMSIYIDRIIGLAGVPEMALQGIVVLGGVLVGGVLVPAPAISDEGLGALLALAALRRRFRASSTSGDA